jgi:hypothetical protein
MRPTWIDPLVPKRPQLPQKPRGAMVPAEIENLTSHGGPEQGQVNKHTLAG